MVKVIMMLVTGLVLFGVSAGVSMFLQPAADESGDEPTESEKSLVSDTKTTAAPVPATSFDDPTMSGGGISTEMVLKLSESIKKREKQLQEREKIVVQQEKRVKFMIDDLHRERQEITAMMEQAETSAEQARSMLERLQQSQPATSGPGSNQGGNGENQANTDEDAPMSEDEKKNLKTVAEWLKSMPEDQAADAIRNFCNDGKMEMAVKLLSFLEQRDAAKILAALQDASLVTQLAERFRKLKRPVKK